MFRNIHFVGYIFFPETCCSPVIKANNIQPSLAKLLNSSIKRALNGYVWLAKPINSITMNSILFTEQPFESIAADGSNQ